MTDPQIRAAAREAEAAILEYGQTYPGWLLTPCDSKRDNDHHLIPGDRGDHHMVINEALHWLIARRETAS
ncbi:hypothetical protein ACWCQZ_49425 [Streptomyces sp. NPDC002285]